MPEKPLKLPHAVIRPAFTRNLFEKKFEIRILRELVLYTVHKNGPYKINLNVRSYSNSLNVYAF